MICIALLNMVSPLTHYENTRKEKTQQIIANRIQTGSLRDGREEKAKESRVPSKYIIQYVELL